jgi:HTH-type transcriptional regulator / antitoxin HigA
VNSEATNHRTPGQLISALLDENGWTKRTASAMLAMSESTLNKIAGDKQPVTAEIAVRLEDVFGVSAEDFLALQQAFDLALARYASPPNPTRAARGKLLSELPISEMVDRHWLAVENPKDIASIDGALGRFFGQSNIESIVALPHAAKKTDQSAPPTMAQLAWLYRTKAIASQLLVPQRFSHACERQLLAKLRPLLVAPEETRKVPRILNEFGIRFVVVECLKGTKIDGVCMWLDDVSPVIAMTTRYDRMDNFWFVLRHELEHVFRGHGKISPVVDSELELADQIDEDEIVANAAASEFCAPNARIDSFIARKAPLFPERDFLGLANILGVHPCLVAGQIRFKTKRFDLFSRHMAKVRSAVLPSAIVDGWGDVAPVEN